MSKNKKYKKALHAKSNYAIVMQLYYLNKTEIKKEPRLPINDFRKPMAKKITLNKPGTTFISVRKALSKIAAFW